MNKDINKTLSALVPILNMNGEKVKSIEAVHDWYKADATGRAYMKEVAEITYENGTVRYADIGCDANLTAVYDVIAVIQQIKPRSTAIERIERGVYDMPTIEPERKNVVEIPETGIGDLSDGYHTFNGLYEQRMILFAALVKAYKDKAWKSYRHEDGEYCFGGGWFIVGIVTPEGSYTYHYRNQYFDLFDCDELPAAKHWDGHTEKDAARLLSLPNVRETEECDG